MVGVEETEQGIKIYCSGLERGLGFFMLDVEPEHYNDFALILDESKLRRPRLRDLVDLLVIVPEISDEGVREKVENIIVYSNRIFGFEIGFFVDKKEIYIVDDTPPQSRSEIDVSFLKRQDLLERIKAGDKRVRKIPYALVESKKEFIGFLIGQDKLEKLQRALIVRGVNKLHLWVPPNFSYSADGEYQGYTIFNFDDLNYAEEGIMRFEIGFDSFNNPIDGLGYGYSFGIFG